MGVVDRVAVVGGTGDLGFALASRWAAAGLDVIIGSRDASRAVEAVDRLRERVSTGTVAGMSNEDAVAAARAVVIAVPFSGLIPIYKSIAQTVTPESVVIDATVPVEASIGGKATHVFGVWEGSAAQLGLAFLPKGTVMCAAFHTLSASAVIDLDTKLQGDVPVCGRKEGKPVARELVDALPDLRFVDAGPLENARIVEPITALLIGLNHRYGTDRAGISFTGLPE